MTAEINAFTHPDAECLCVAEHNPTVVTFHQHHIWPLAMGGPDTWANIVTLCPTSHANVHHLLREWVRAAGPPPWTIRRRFNHYVRGLAETGWYTATRGRLLGT